MKALTLAFLCASVGLLCAQKVDVGPIRYSYPKLGPPWPAPKHPSWVNQGIVFVGSWEPYAWELRKNWQNWGSARTGTDAAALHKLDRSEASVLALQQMGVNMVLTSFHKGFGIANEADTMEETRRYAQVLHRHGMKIGVLVSTLLLYEDLYGEIPESKTWHRMLYDGSPDTYGNDGYRYRAYLNHPAYMNYMKKVCELAVKDGIDAIFFDTVRQMSENHHPLAEEMFREWLKARYPTKEAWYFRSGLHYWDFVKIPHYSETAELDTIDQSIGQEYIDFKTQQIADFAAEMKTFISRLNPETALWFNTGGITGVNTMQNFNMDYARLLPWLDLYYTEEQDYAAYTPEGGIISKIRTIKASRSFGAVHTNAAGQPPPRPERSLDFPHDDPRLRLAEAMAFNRNALGNMGYGSRNVIDGFPAAGRKYLQFYRDHFKTLLAGSESAADVAVLRTYASMAYNNFETHQEAMLAEQALIQGQIPFDILFDKDLDGPLSRYKVIVLGDQESMTAKQVETLRNYVRGGGAIVATDDTSVYDEWRRQRASMGLSDVLGVNLPPKSGEPQSLRHEFGSGRAAYLRRLIPSVKVPPRMSFGVKYWAPPRNHDEFLGAVRWASRDRLTWRVQAPPYVAAEACYQPASRRYVLHLVNYNCWKQADVKGIQVSVNLPDAASFKTITIYSPDDEKPALVTPAAGTIAIPHLGIYDIVTIER